MRALIWNFRGFGNRGRRNQLKDYLRKYKVDILFLQETIRQDFSLQELEVFEFGDKFYWTWLPAVGQSGGMLMGLRDSTFEVGATDQGVFFLSATILHRASRFIFEFIGVYGPADHSRSRDFLAELETKVSISQYQWWWQEISTSFEEVLIKTTPTLIGLGFDFSMTLLLE
jgi:exonuclease III